MNHPQLPAVVEFRATWTRVPIAIFIVGASLLAVVLSVGMSVEVRYSFRAGAAVFLVGGLHRAWRLCLRISERGVEIVNLLSRHFFAWHELESVGLRQSYRAWLGWGAGSNALEFRAAKKKVTADASINLRQSEQHHLMHALRTHANPSRVTVSFSDNDFYGN